LVLKHIVYIKIMLSGVEKDNNLMLTRRTPVATLISAIVVVGSNTAWLEFSLEKASVDERI